MLLCVWHGHLAGQQVPAKDDRAGPFGNGVTTASMRARKNGIISPNGNRVDVASFPVEKPGSWSSWRTGLAAR